MTSNEILANEGGGSWSEYWGEYAAWVVADDVTWRATSWTKKERVAAIKAIAEVLDEWAVSSFPVLASVPILEALEPILAARDDRLRGGS